jgi:hypothetical protein
MTTVMIVKCEDISKTPKQFQQYVADWFAPINLLGIDCMWASGLLFVDHTHYPRKGQHPGYAPTHSVDTREYDIGKLSVGDWMRQNRGKLVWLLYPTEERRNDCCIDDD